MAKYGRYEDLDLQSEAELEGLLAAEPGAIEPGLVLLTRQWKTGRGPLDLLLMDQDRRVVVAELKLGSDDDMLMQGLDYLAWVHENIDAIARGFKEHQIAADEPPRLILIAQSFSDALRARARYIKDEMQPTLLCYRAIRHGNEPLVVTHEVDIAEVPEPLREVVREKDHRDYLVGDDLRKLWDGMASHIKLLSPDDVVSYSTMSYLGFRYKGRVIALLYPRKRYFYIGNYKDGAWVYTRIANEEELKQVKAHLSSGYVTEALSGKTPE